MSAAPMALVSIIAAGQAQRLYASQGPMPGSRWAGFRKCDSLSWRARWLLRRIRKRAAQRALDRTEETEADKRRFDAYLRATGQK